MWLLTLPAVVGIVFGRVAVNVGEIAVATTTQSLFSEMSANRLFPLLLAQSEVHIDQATGRISNGKLPEVGTSKKSGGAGSADSNSRPITCNASNATSPDCYAATQQARPLAK